MPHETEAVRDKRFQAEQDVRTLVDAEKIKKDPQRLKAARASAKEQRAALDKVKGES